MHNYLYSLFIYFCGVLFRLVFKKLKCKIETNGIWKNKDTECYKKKNEK